MIDSNSTSPQDALKRLSLQDFLHMGKDQIAYVRPLDDEPGFTVHGADGLPVASIGSYASAVAYIRQHEMFPVTLH